jgi:YD repeat-containing protein
MGREVTPLGASGIGVRRLAAAAVLALSLASGSAAFAFDGPEPGAVTATSLTLPDGPASVRGLADAATVDVFTAQVGFAIPIDLPKGPGGSGPSFALQYNGETGNGPLGIGWSLGSIMIKRSERFGVPTFTDNDELDLVGIGGGGRLVRDPDHPSPQQYWVEGRGHSIRVVKQNARFEVTDANGVRYFLGNSSDSREEQGQRVSAWMADWAVDVAGNEIDFSYMKGSNRLYLESITWGPEDNGAPAYQMLVHYEARKDVAISYRAGFPISTASRVVSIEVDSFGHTLWTYTPTYDQTFALSRLVQVDQTGLDVQAGKTALTGENSLPPVKLTYGGMLQPETISFAATDGWTLNQRGVVVADVNGDGMADLLRLEAGDPEFLEGRGNYFGTAQAVTGASDFGLDTAALVDLDGDSRPELVHVVDDTWRAFSLSGTSWQPLGEWKGTENIPLKGSNVVLADLNGDGKIDVVRPRGSGGINVNFGGVGGLGATLEMPPLSASDVAVVPGDPQTRFIDVNGDGLADVVWVTDAWMKIFLGRGDGTFVPYVRAPYPWGSSAGVDLANIMFADLNRDGLADLVKVDAANVTWFRGETDGRFGVFFRHLARPESVDADAVVTIADLDGNGSQDVVWSSPRGLWALDLAGATSAGMITQIDNGLGMTTTFTYDASGNMAVAAERSGSPWQVLLPESIPVPVTVETDPGAGDPHRVTQHLVRDGFWDGVERRFGGFLFGRKTTVAADPTKSTVVETHFLQGAGSDRELRGRPSSVQSSGGDGTVFSLAKSTWAAVPVPGLPNSPLTSKAALNESQLFLYEGRSSPFEIRTTYQLDNEVRPTLETHLGRVDLSGDEMIVQHIYQSDSQTGDLGVRDRDCEDVTFEGDGMTVVSDVQRLYGDATATILPFGQVGKGWVRVEQEFLATEGYVPQKTTSYDTFGNPTSTTSKGVTRDVTYELGLFPTAESIEGTNPPLGWGATWDHVRDRIHTVTDPNTNVTDVEYDHLGRPISVALGAFSPHIHYGYQWAPPLPSTTSWVFDGDATALGTEGPTWPVGPHWRSTTSVTNGATEALFSTTPVTTSVGNQFIVSGWKQRDERGQTVQSAEPFYVSTEPTVSPPVPAMDTRIQVIAYDSQGRVVLETLPNGATKQTSYRALGQTLTSTELGPVSSDTDGLSRIVHTERDPGTGVIESVDATYDAAGRIKAMRLQGGQVVHSFVYDTVGRLTSANDPDIGPRQLFYNDANQLTQYTNGIGQSIYFGYDAAGRLTRRGETQAPSAATDYTYTYDSEAASLGPALNTICQVPSRLAAVTEPQGTVQFCYDALGRQIAMGRTIVVPDAPAAAGGKSQTLSFSGLLLTETFDDGFNTLYGYDGAGRVTSVSSDGSALWTADTIDAAGRVTLEHYGNGATEAYKYDPLGLAQHMTVTSPVSQTSLYEVAVTRNAYGAPTMVEDVAKENGGQGLDQAATYGYDGAGRLTSATMGKDKPYTFGYQYDALQNMTLRTVSGPTDIGILAGTYRYGERGYGPRQLTSVVPGGGP